jgi:metal-responsive CopG/Arc/MetJ family transcriptional regulator
MAQASKAKKYTTGVSLDLNVLRYLDEIANSDDRDRSYIINRIVREYAQQKGTPIPPANATQSKVLKSA